MISGKTSPYPRPSSFASGAGWSMRLEKAPQLGEPTFVADFFRAWRYWLIERDTSLEFPSRQPVSALRLVSGHGGIRWEPFRRFEAACPKGSPIAPCGPAACISAGYGCGVYAVVDPRDVPVPDSPDCIVALGLVALWGRIFEHKNGYRAQFAYPLRFEKILLPWQQRPRSTRELLELHEKGEDVEPESEKIRHELSVEYGIA